MLLLCSDDAAYGYHCLESAKAIFLCFGMFFGVLRKTVLTELFDVGFNTVANNRFGIILWETLGTKLELVYLGGELK